MNNTLLDLITRHLGGGLPPDPQNRYEGAGTIRATPPPASPAISAMMYASPDRSGGKSGSQTQGIMDKLMALLHTGRLPYEDRPVGSYNTTQTQMPGGIM